MSDALDRIEALHADIEKRLDEGDIVDTEARDLAVPLLVAVARAADQVVVLETHPKATREGNRMMRDRAANLRVALAAVERYAKEQLP